MAEHYILDADGNPVEADLMTWAKWFGTADAERTVNQTELDGGAVRVSTVFLGLDHRFGDGPPILYETMIFGGPRDQDTWRYETRAEAIAGHRHACLVALTPPEDDEAP